jgi:hypothetical protein
MVTSAKTKLVDAQNEDLDPDSQFDLGYGAAHQLALGGQVPGTSTSGSASLPGRSSFGAYHDLERNGLPLPAKIVSLCCW